MIESVCSKCDAKYVSAGMQRSGFASRDHALRGGPEIFVRRVGDVLREAV
jgi:hypothetical protein